MNGFCQIYWESAFKMVAEIFLVVKQQDELNKPVEESSIR
jgi:hypothetical protein